MNREFKFRVWDDKLKTFSYFDLFSAYGNIPEDLRKNVCESTCVKDKNHKEIFEGDVVKTCKDFNIAALSTTFVEYDKGVVEWVNEGFNICQAMIGRTHFEVFRSCDCCPCALEVIGNVFENPELLK